MSESAPLLLTTQGLGSTADRLVVRDPRGRTATPGVQPCDQGLVVRGPVALRLDYVVEKDPAIRFLDATGDDNRIHREENIIPGALTASKVMALVEVLAPDLHIHDVRAKFTAPAYYGARNFANIRIEPQPDGRINVAAESFFQGELVAKTTMSGRVVPFAERSIAVKERKVNAESVALVESYFQALGLDPEGYFAKIDAAGGRDFTFPVSFLASLPPGEMVRRFAGQGGMLNALNLNFSEAPRLPITGPTLPEIALEHGKARKASLFARIMTRIVEGLTTYGKGFALVANGAGLQDRLRK